MFKNEFFTFFLVFLETGVSKELRFCALHSMHQDASFEQSKSTVGKMFTLRGDRFNIKGTKKILYNKF